MSFNPLFFGLAGQSVEGGGGGGEILHVDNGLSLDTGTFLFQGRLADDYYTGQANFDPGANITVVKLRFVLSSNGDITGKTYKAEIWNYSGGSLTTLVEASAGVPGAAWTQTAVDFSFSGAALTSGSKYGLVVTSNAAADASNFIRVWSTAGGAVDGVLATWNAARALTANTSDDIKLSVWKS